MPSVITDVATFTTPVTTVADGDPATGANVAVAIQQLANRTAYLQSNRVRRIETNSALAALTNMLDGEVFLVRGSAGGITESMYIYDANSTLGATYQAFNYVVQPNSIIGANPGRFINVLAPIVSLTDPLGRLNAQGPNALIAVQQTQDISQTVTNIPTTGSPFYLTSTSVVLSNVKTGDIILAECSTRMSVNGSTYTLACGINVFDGSVNTQINTTYVPNACGFALPVTHIAQYVAAANITTLTVQMYAYTTTTGGTGTPQTIGPSTVRARIVRP